MATKFEIDSALMAGMAYRSNRAGINRFPLPSGWSEIPLSYIALPSGFEAVSFLNGNEIVISFAGTNFTEIADWTQANIPLAFGFGSDQLRQAALYYLEVKTANPTAIISFTGHSLGGGLAALMAVLFDEQAITFDQAPFSQAASIDTRDDFVSFLNTQGHTTPSLMAFVPELFSFDPYGPPSASRAFRVNGYFVQGEVLQSLQGMPLSLSTIGAPTPLTHNGVGVGSIDLHAQALLAAFLENDAFRAITFSLPELLKMVFDEALYAYKTTPDNTEFPNLLEHLLRHQIGIAPDPSTGTAAIPADAMLDRFVVDLAKLTPDTYGMASGTDMAKALTTYAMEYHYLKTTGTTQAFIFDTYGLHFKYSDIGATSYKSLPKLADAVSAYLTAQEQTLLNGRLVKQDAWHIQSGTGGMIVHAGADNDTLIGGTNADALWGGGRIDILIGGADNDVLVGEAGNDYLLGGIGNDTYIFATGDGTDTILDTDGNGSIVFNGQTLTGGALVAGTTNVWKNTAQGITYTLQGSGANQLLIIGKDGTTTGLRIQGWQDGQLGLTMSGAGTPASPAVISGADGYSDSLTGSGGADRILGLSGNDALDGSAGDDIIEGGLGDDLIGGGAGSDLIYGGAGKDMILSATGLDAPPRDANHDGVFEDWAPPAGAGAVWTQGRTWGVYASTDANGPVYIIDGGGSLAQDSAGDIVFAGDDDDRVVGGLGDDYIDGGLANDDLSGHGGNDVVDGAVHDFTWRVAA